MDTFTIILALIICIPILLGMVFLISGFITSKVSDDEKKPNTTIFVVVFIIVLITLLIFYNDGNESTHMFRP